MSDAVRDDDAFGRPTTDIFERLSTEFMNGDADIKVRTWQYPLNGGTANHDTHRSMHMVISTEWGYGQS